jgi:hypothetical protein
MEAKIGGIPSVANRIRGYMNIALKRSGFWTTPRLEVRMTSNFSLIFCVSHFLPSRLYRCCMTFPYGHTCSSSSAQVAQMLPWNLWVVTKHCLRQSHNLYTFCKNTLRILITCKIVGSSNEYSNSATMTNTFNTEHPNTLEISYSNHTDAFAIPAREVTRTRLLFIRFWADVSCIRRTCPKSPQASKIIFGCRYVHFSQTWKSP